LIKIGFEKFKNGCQRGAPRIPTRRSLNLGRPRASPCHSERLWQARYPPRLSLLIMSAARALKRSKPFLATCPRRGCGHRLRREPAPRIHLVTTETSVTSSLPDICPQNPHCFVRFPGRQFSVTFQPIKISALDPRPGSQLRPCALIALYGSLSLSQSFSFGHKAFQASLVLLAQIASRG
jgi:hypothetical protein